MKIFRNSLVFIVECLGILTSSIDNVVVTQLKLGNTKRLVVLDFEEQITEIL